jgi:hypothetical protein
VLVLAVLAFVVGALLSKANAQVTDTPVTARPALNKLVVEMDSMGRMCAVWWARDSNRYGDYHLAAAVLDPTKVAASVRDALKAAIVAQDVAALTKMRTHDVRDLREALELCVPSDEPSVDPAVEAKRQRMLDALSRVLQPAAWIVSKSSSADGTNPAYCLKADGTRDTTKSCGRAASLVPGTTKPMWCDCLVRSVETTQTSYCSWPFARQTFDPNEPQRVTRCTENVSGL